MAKKVLMSGNKVISTSNGAITFDVKDEQEKAVTPTAEGIVVVPDTDYTLSKVTVNGDSNLVASNIKSGVSIFGVAGTLESGGSTPTNSLTTLSIISNDDYDYDVPYMITYQTANGQMFSCSDYTTTESFTLEDALVGGIVIMSISPDLSIGISFDSGDNVEEILILDAPQTTGVEHSKVIAFKITGSSSVSAIIHTTGG